MKKEVILTFSTKLSIVQKVSVVKYEDEEKEMIGDLFDIMTLEDDILSDDPVYMIYDAPGGKGKGKEIVSDYLRG